MIELECDVLVIGAGVLGMSSAYHIKKGNPDKRVVLIEKNSSPALGNTRKSEGGYRNVFTSKVNRALSDSTIDWFLHLSKDPKTDIGIEPIGYLWLLSQEQIHTYRDIVNELEKQEALRVLDFKSLREAMPFLETEPKNQYGFPKVSHALYAPKCGSVAPRKLVSVYEDLFKRGGGEIRYSVEAKNLILKPENPLGIDGEPMVWQDKVFRGADTSIGVIKADTTVVACGAWSGELLHPVGLDSFMRPKKRQIFVFKDDSLKPFFNDFDLNDVKAAPLTILPVAGAYFKPAVKLGAVWVGCADDIGREFRLEDEPKPEPEYYENDVKPVISSYFPSLGRLDPVGMWAGQYSINSLDNTPVVEKTEGLIYVGAASGSGIMKSDSLGRVVQALYSDERQAELFNGEKIDCSALGIRNRKVLPEKFVI